MDALVGEAQHAKALRAQSGVADLIPNAVFMMRTVRFDDEAVTQAKKVDDVPTERDLATKLQSTEATVPQERPQ